jgi:hypothetical protein
MSLVDTVPLVGGERWIYEWCHHRQRYLVMRVKDLVIFNITYALAILIGMTPSSWMMILH